jgi:hypothetical protein
MDRIEVGAVSMFREMFLRFDVDRIEDKTIELIGSGCDPKDVLRAAQECIQEVGRKFECRDHRRGSDHEGDGGEPEGRCADMGRV